MSEDTMHLPLFALDTVLFPGMVLPLHVFEERYKQMMRHCIDAKEPFGVVLVRGRRETGRTSVLHLVGTSARVARVELLEEGDMSVVAVGLERFRIRRIHHETPYLVAEVEPFPAEKGHSEASRTLMKEIKPYFVRYIRLLSEALGNLIQIENVPTDITATAYLIAMALQVSVEEKQDILSMATVPEMLVREAYLLDREEQLLKQIIANQGNTLLYQGGVTLFFSMN